MNTYYKILNEIAATFNMDQWDDQVNLFTNVIKEQLKPFVHNTKYDWIYILENSFDHDFPQFNFYKQRCYVNGEKVELTNRDGGKIDNKWKNQKTVNVIIKDLDQLGESCTFMFYNCFSLISVPWFNTSGVTNMDGMFYRCWSLETVPLFDTHGATKGSMFYDCHSLSKETKKAWSSVYNFETNIE